MGCQSITGRRHTYATSYIMGNLKKRISLNACHWTARGNLSTQRKPMWHRQNKQPHTEQRCGSGPKPLEVMVLPTRHSRNNKYMCSNVNCTLIYLQSDFILEIFPFFFFDQFNLMPLIKVLWLITVLPDGCKLHGKDKNVIRMSGFYRALLGFPKAVVSHTNTMSLSAFSSY